MAVFGLIFSALIYLSLIALLIFIFIIFFKKMYTLSYELMMVLFLHGLITLMCLSWGIIIMSGGFKVSMSVYLNNDYTWIMFFFLGLLFILVAIDFIQKKHMKDKQNNFFLEASRYLLPMLNVIIITGCTFLIYSSINYFKFLTL